MHFDPSNKGSMQNTHTYWKTIGSNCVIISHQIWFFFQIASVHFSFENKKNSNEEDSLKFRPMNTLIAFSVPDFFSFGCSTCYEYSFRLSPLWPRKSFFVYDWQCPEHIDKHRFNCRHQYPKVIVIDWQIDLMKNLWSLYL